MKLNLFPICLVLVASQTGFAQDKLKESSKDAIEFSYDEKTNQSEQSYYSGFERIFRNPALASGIASGSEAINRSIESLMDALFYSLLDNEFVYDLSDDSQFVADLRRDLYPTPAGGYVVIDRVALGPSYNKVMTEVQKVPISLGVDGRVNVFDIYLRTDGQRLAEQEDLPFWRMAMNNWLGVLPFLKLVMPPSFNANELYDPLRQLETPFVFPFTANGFRSMPIGSIRSYSVSGGINVPFGLNGAFGRDIVDALKRAENLQAALPYTVFVRGEHRINVLRRSENVAWVGVSNVKRFGHSITATIGEKLFALQKVIPAWKGVPVPLFPLDIEVAQSMAWKYDQLYSFDLTLPAAQEAYASAVFGNFEPAHARYLDQREKGIMTGVAFEFTRHEDADEKSGRNGPNIFVARSLRQHQRSKSEVEITDQEGKFQVLEAKETTLDESWDVLVGSQEKEYQDRVELRVKRVIDTDQTGPHPEDEDLPTRYIFSADDTDPYKLTLSLRIQDNYVDAAEYREYLKELRYFTKLTIADAPYIPIRDPAAMRARRLRRVAGDPMADITDVHVTPTYLGRFGATAAVVLSTEQLKRIINAPETAQWAAFAEAYNLKRRYWREKSSRTGGRAQLEWLGFMAAYPARLLNMRFASADAIREASNAISALKQLREVKDPLEIWTQFHKLLATDHPLQLTRALLNLADLKDTPRSVSFYTTPKGRAPRFIKDAFGKLNNRVYNSIKAMPPPERSRIAQEKLQAFFPEDVRERRLQPVILKISIRPKLLPESYLAARTSRQLSNDDIASSKPTKKTLDRQVYLDMRIKNITPDKIPRIYVRVEQGGMLQVGNFVLAEDVFKFAPSSAATAVPDAEIDPLQPQTPSEDIQFYLTGPLSPINNFFYEGAVESGGTYHVVVAVSADGQVWSDEKTFRFRFEDGKLMPP